MSNMYILTIVYIKTMYSINQKYTKILEVNLFAFAYRLFHRDFSPLNGREERNLYETVCR